MGSKENGQEEETWSMYNYFEGFCKEQQSRVKLWGQENLYSLKKELLAVFVTQSLFFYKLYSKLN